MKWRKSGKRTAPSCWVRSHGVMNGRLAGSLLDRDHEVEVGEHRRAQARPVAPPWSLTRRPRPRRRAAPSARAAPAPRPCPSAWSATATVAAKPSGAERRPAAGAACRGSSVVSHSCSAFISPRPLKRLMLQLPSRAPSLRSLSSVARQLAVVERVDLGRRLLAARRRVDAKQRRLGDVDVAALDQLREVAEEQRQQQHLDVRAVDVGVGQDADLAVAQAAEVGRRRRRRAGRRRSPPRCRGSRCWRTGGRARPPRR